MSWRDRAACRAAEPSLFFPADGWLTEEAHAYCRACPVTDECLDYARRTDQLHGIWGGVSEKARSGVPEQEFDFCKFEDCEGDAVRQGWCWLHYGRWLRNGDPGIVRKRGRPRKGSLREVASGKSSSPSTIGAS